MSNLLAPEALEGRLLFAIPKKGVCNLYSKRFLVLLYPQVGCMRSA